MQLKLSGGGKKQMVVVEARDRKLSPHIEIVEKRWKNTYTELEQFYLLKPL